MHAEVKFFPDDKTVKVMPGVTLLHASRLARVQIRARCGGNASCLMCKVQVVDQSGLSLLTVNEEMKLGDLKKQHYRLACQAKVRGSVKVMIPEDPLKAAIRAQLAKQQEDDLW